MSMEELDRIVRNVNLEEHFRRRCLQELKAREGKFFATLTDSHSRGSLQNPQYVAPGL